MDGNQILLLGLGIEIPWKLVDQRLDMDMDMDKTPRAWRQVSLPAVWPARLVPFSNPHETSKSLS